MTTFLNFVLGAVLCIIFVIWIIIKGDNDNE